MSHRKTSPIKRKCKTGDRKTFGQKEPKLGITSVTLPGDHKNPSANHVKTVIIISLSTPAFRLHSFTTASAFLPSGWNLKGIPFLFRTLFGALVKTQYGFLSRCKTRIPRQWMILIQLNILVG